MIGLDVIGVSPDKMKPIEKFAEKYGLTFPLASDETQAVAEAYGTWVEKHVRQEVHGHGAQHVPDRQARQDRPHWRKVKVDGHAAEVMEAAKGLG